MSEYKHKMYAIKLDHCHGMIRATVVCGTCGYTDYTMQNTPADALQRAKQLSNRHIDRYATT